MSCLHNIKHICEAAAEVGHRLIRPRWAKHSRPSLELNLLLPLFVLSALYHLTQPTGLTSLNLVTGSMSNCPCMVMLLILRWSVG